MNPKAFIFFGRSGCGKGTQAQLLLDYLKEKNPEADSLYIQTGAEFRKFMEQDNFTSKRVGEFLSTGKLLPEFLPIWMWTSIFIDKFTAKENLVFDGISRRVEEAPVLDGALDFYDIKDRYVVYINVSEGWARERLLARGRSDDEKKEIDERLAWFEKHVAPVVEIFRKNNKYTFLDINGEQSIDDVHKDIISAING